MLNFFLPEAIQLQNFRLHGTLLVHFAPFIRDDVTYFSEEWKILTLLIELLEELPLLRREEQMGDLAGKVPMSHGPAPLPLESIVAPAGGHETC